GVRGAETRTELERAGKTLGIELSTTPIGGQDVDTVLGRAKTGGASGVIAPPDYVTFIHRKRLVEAALKHQLPGCYWTREYVEAGGQFKANRRTPRGERRCETPVDEAPQ